MNHITGYCFTNLDDYRQVKWPNRFVAVPRVGECVESMDKGCYLKVGRVTHAVNSSGPYIRVELHKTVG